MTPAEKAKRVLALAKKGDLSQGHLQEILQEIVGDTAKSLADDILQQVTAQAPVISFPGPVHFNSPCLVPAPKGEPVDDFISKVSWYQGPTVPPSAKALEALMSTNHNVLTFAGIPVIVSPHVPDDQVFIVENPANGVAGVGDYTALLTGTHPEKDVLDGVQYHHKPQAILVNGINLSKIQAFNTGNMSLKEAKEKLATVQAAKVAEEIRQKIRKAEAPGRKAAVRELEEKVPKLLEAAKKGPVYLRIFLEEALEEVKDDASS